jgi:hypothetical protein
VKSRRFDGMVQKVNSTLQVRFLFKQYLANRLGYTDQLDVVFPEPGKD